MTSRNALPIALIEYHVAVGDNFIGGLVDSYLVGLQTVRSNPSIDIALAD